MANLKLRKLQGPPFLSRIVRVRFFYSICCSIDCLGVVWDAVQTGRWDLEGESQIESTDERRTKTIRGDLNKQHSDFIITARPLPWTLPVLFR